MIIRTQKDLHVVTNSSFGADRRQAVSYFLVNSCREQFSRAGTEIDQHGEEAQVSRYPTVNQSSA
ncbi:MAG: hypothetical protein QOE55_398 [Acidobacteriaceae bacterium]|nr:hypothetical protein [Acidobacteriaceae bacterium]